MKKDWEIKRLGDVCDIINGKNQKAVEDKNGLYPIYGSGGIMGYASDYLCRENTTIIGRKGSINNPLYVEEKFWNVDTAFGFQSKDNYIPKLLFYFCKSLDFSTHNKGTTIPSLVKSDLLEIPIPVPSLEEQKRIVKILDEKFAQLESLKATAQTNLQNAKDLFQSQLTKAFSNNTWEKKTIGDICILKSGNSSSNNSKPGNLPYVKVGDMTINGNEKTITTSTLFVDYEENKKNIFPKGTVIFPKRGGAILTNKKRLTAVEICCDLNIMGVIPTDKILSEFLYYYFIGIDFAELCNGAAIPQINNIDINPLTIPLPPLPEQKRIVKELDTLSEKVRQLQEIYTKQIANCDELKQAYLQKAFEGEL